MSATVEGFFDPELSERAEAEAQGSSGRDRSVERITEHLRGFEAFLVEAEVWPFERTVQSVTFRMDGPSEDAGPTLGVLDDGTGLSCPITDLPIERRLAAYRALPELADQLQDAEVSEETDRREESEGPTTLASVLKSAVERSRHQILEHSPVDPVLTRLRELRHQVPTGKERLQDRAAWFRDVARTLLQLHAFESVMESARNEIPRVWSLLTFRQKLQVAAIVPAIGAGATVGAIGVAGLGSAVGVPGVVVILAVLFMTNGLVGFLDYIIGLLSRKGKLDPGHEALASAFETAIADGLRAVFERDYQLHGKSVSAGAEGTTSPARRFEHRAVQVAAREFEGEGRVTSAGSDGGIDGYVVKKETEEVFLVQAKMYSSKVGFPEATQYLGTLMFWKEHLASRFEYPIRGMIIVGASGFSVEARRVERVFSDSLFLFTA